MIYMLQICLIFFLKRCKNLTQEKTLAFQQKNNKNVSNLWYFGYNKITTIPVLIPENRRSTRTLITSTDEYLPIKIQTNNPYGSPCG
jgi:hypothetical protein